MIALEIFRSLSSIFLSSVAPPLAIAFVGYLLGISRDVNIDGLSAIAVYILLPALVFETLVSLTVDVSTVTTVAGAMVGFTTVMGLIAWAVSQVRGQNGTIVYGAAMAAAIPNVGNFGIPVATFAFGTPGRSTAVLFVLVQNLVLYTIGIYLLSKGRPGSSHIDAFKQVLTQPVTYAVIVAVIAVTLGVTPSQDGTIMQTLRLMGDSSIPVFLLILGLQVAKMDIGTTVYETLPTVGLKLFVAPIVAVVISFLVNVEDLAMTHAFIVLAAGPSAVTPLVLSIEFADDGNAALSTGDYVGTVIFLTILGSLPIVTGLLLLIKMGVVG